MLLESALAYVHLAFIFSLIVFQGSLAALLRAEWFNAAVLARLQRIVLINKAAMALVIATGVARFFWGIKPAAWYLANPLMHAKLTLVVILIGYHHMCGAQVKRFARGENTRSHVFFRWFNEVPVLILLAIVILVVVRPF